MIGQYQNKILSSFILWLDNKILTDGRAFSNVSSSFYKNSGINYGYYTYSSPYGQIIYDSSISGANILSGVYLNNIFITGNQSGFAGINYDKGYLLFNSQISNSISGNYAIKDFNIVLTDDQEETILFKNKYHLKPKSPQTLAGIPENYIQYPVIFVKNDGGNNESFALGGLEQTNSFVRCIILADSLFNLHAVESILKDSVRTPVALFESNEMPFNALGSLKSGVYNYTGIANTKINEQNFAFIEDVSIPRSKQRFASSAKDLVGDVYFNFIDIQLVTFRNPRSK